MSTTELEQRVAQLEAAQKRAELIAQINAALSRATNEQEILSAVASLAVQNGVTASSLAYVKEVNDGIVTSVELVAVQDANGQFPPLEALPFTKIVLDDMRTMKLGLENPDEPVFVENMFTDPRTEAGNLREVAQQTGVTASVNLWFMLGEQEQGCMSFVWAEEHPFSAELRTVLKAIQPVAGAIVANRRLLLASRKEANENAWEAKIFRSLVENSPEAIMMVELDSDRIVYANQECHKLYGYDYSTQEMTALKGKTTIFPPDALPRLEREILPVLGENGWWSGEIPQIRKDGSIFETSGTAFILKDNDGRAPLMCVMTRDITEQKRAEAEREALQQQVIDAQRQALAELSTPIIPIMDRIIVMPLVGGIDTTRSRDIMRSLLEGISQYRAQIAILDITGVPVVDSGVADHLNRTMQAARLKGAQTIITGVSDAVAETIVDLGIDWSGFETLRDLQTGLVTALERVGFQLTRHSTNGKNNS